ncbi:MAG: argininosuccinate lyase [Chloroflexota bacterium]|nr:argininosuccinate lyase [Chloroflexota bacterium]
MNNGTSGSSHSTSPATGGLESASFIVSPTQIALDTAMLRHDVWGSMAHVLMLHHVGVIATQAAVAICRALEGVQQGIDEGTFHIDPSRGAQLSLERGVIATIGVEDGSRMHTARSRNDQVMLTEMLYLRERALELAAEGCHVVDALLSLAKEHTSTVMPGYTHMQPAKPTTLGQWALAYADGMLRALDDLRYTWEQYDACPLGAVESYGTSWPIDREYAAQLLGFSRVWEVPQDVIGSRGMLQLAYLDVCKRLATVMSKIAADLLLFTTWEYGYFELGEAVAQRLHPITGSSVMAQKRNPDALELLRATGHQVLGIAATASHLLAGLPMGYNRDSREIKEWSALGFDKTLSALHTLRTTLATLQVDQERMLAAVKDNYSSTTDLADAIAQVTGAGYRQVYAIVGRLVDRMIEEGRPLHDLKAAEIVEAAQLGGLHISISDELIQEALDPEKALARRTHTGGAAPGEMARMIGGREEALAGHYRWLGECNMRIETARRNTAERIVALNVETQQAQVPVGGI